MLVLRTCAEDLTSYEGRFQWPASGPVECPDWNPADICGYGLHGLPWGEGRADLLDLSPNAKWLVVDVEDSTVVHITANGGGKCKFPRGNVVYCGTRDEAVAYLYAHGGTGRAAVFGTATAGIRGTATAGYSGTATAGDGGTATAGDSGTATAGYGGTATAGIRGTATAGDSGTATAGYGGTIEIAYWDDSADRRRIKIGYIGEDGLEPGVQYRLDQHHKFCVVSRPAAKAADNLATV